MSRFYEVSQKWLYGHAGKCAPIFHGSPPKWRAIFQRGLRSSVVLAAWRISQVEGGSQVKATCSQNRVAYFTLHIVQSSGKIVNCI